LRHRLTQTGNIRHLYNNSNSITRNHGHYFRVLMIRTLPPIGCARSKGQDESLAVNLQVI
jgi:hypothetical protein